MASFSIGFLGAPHWATVYRSSWPFPSHEKTIISPRPAYCPLLPRALGTDARREPAVVRRTVTDQDKSFWEGWGELEGGRGDLFSKALSQQMVDF